MLLRSYDRMPQRRSCCARAVPSAKLKANETPPLMRCANEVRREQNAFSQVTAAYRDSRRLMHRYERMQIGLVVMAPVRAAIRVRDDTLDRGDEG